MSLDESLEICVHMICQKYDIKNYTINEDGSIDVDGSVYLFQRGLTELPVQFRIVTGDFHCAFNKLTTLQGAPQTVGEGFYCNGNPLTSMSGAPQSRVGASIVRMMLTYQKLKLKNIRKRFNA